MNTACPLRAAQRGNALFLILIAVALFAALSYAITQSGRGSGSGITREKNVLLAAQLTQSTATVRAAAMRLRMSGVAAKDIKFTTAVSSYAVCTDTDGTCVFEASGGGATYPVIPSEAIDPAFLDLMGGTPFVGFFEVERTVTFDNQSFVGAGTDAKDAIMIVPGIRQDICTSINTKLGITGIPVEDDVLDDTAKTITLPDNKVEGCFYWAENEAYAYIAAIIEN